MKQFIRVNFPRSDARTAHVRLPGFESFPGVVAKTLSLDDVVEGYKGPRVHLEFSHAGELIAIEILVSVNEQRTPRSRRLTGRVDDRRTR